MFDLDRTKCFNDIFNSKCIVDLIDINLQDISFSHHALINRFIDEIYF